MYSGAIGSNASRRASCTPPRPITRSGSTAAMSSRLGSKNDPPISWNSSALLPKNRGSEESGSFTATGSSPSSAMMSGQISVRHATRTGRVANVRVCPVLSVSETVEGVAVGDTAVAAGVCVGSG